MTKLTEKQQARAIELIQYASALMFDGQEDVD